MSKIRVLLAGESWVSTTGHVKGFNQFTTTEYQTGLAGLQKELADSDVDLVHMPGHLVPTDFPGDRAGLEEFDVVALSDIGADSLLLHPDTFVRGQRTPNRLKLIADWVGDGGGFMMIGGYFTFQGINGAARYHRTPVEAILPVTMMATDDRVEVPEGFEPAITEAGRGHAALSGLDGAWPYLLGHNEVHARKDGDVLLTAGPGPDALPLLVAGQHGAGRTMAWTSDIGPHWLPQAFIDWPGYGRMWRQVFGWLVGR